MARLQGLVFLCALFVAVLGATTPFKPKMCQRQAAHVKTIQNAFAYPKELCHWYISAHRYHSPLSTMSPFDFTAACECIAAKVASTKHVGFVAPAGFAPTCKKGLRQRVGSLAFKQPKHFCDFWGTGVNNSFRKVTPFAKQGLTNIDIYNGCACFYTAASTTSAVPSETATATETATETGTVGPTGTATGTETPSASITGTESPSASATDSSVIPSLSATDVSATPSITGDLSSVLSSLIPSATGDLSSVIPSLTGDLSSLTTPPASLTLSSFTTTTTTTTTTA